MCCHLSTASIVSSLNNILPHRLTNISIAIFFHQFYKSFVYLSDKLWSLEDHTCDERHQACSLFDLVIRVFCAEDSTYSDDNNFLTKRSVGLSDKIIGLCLCRLSADASGNIFYLMLLYNIFSVLGEVGNYNSLDMKFYTRFYKYF